MRRPLLAGSGTSSNGQTALFLFLISLVSGVSWAQCFREPIVACENREARSKSTTREFFTEGGEENKDSYLRLIPNPLRFLRLLAKAFGVAFCRNSPRPTELLLPAGRMMTERVPEANRAFSANEIFFIKTSALPQAPDECCAFGSKQILCRVGPIHHNNRYAFLSTLCAPVAACRRLRHICVADRAPDRGQRPRLQLFTGPIRSPSRAGSREWRRTSSRRRQGPGRRCWSWRRCRSGSRCCSRRHCWCRCCCWCWTRRRRRSAGWGNSHVINILFVAADSIRVDVVSSSIRHVASGIVRDDRNVIAYLLILRKACLRIERSTHRNVRGPCHAAVCAPGIE